MSWRAVTRRACRLLVSAAASLLLLSFVCFALLDAAPGDYVTDAALNPQISEEAAQSMRQRLGLSRSLLARYGGWLAGIPQGRLGISYAYGVDASVLLLPRMGATLLLNAAAILLAIAVALPLALLAAQRPAAKPVRLLNHTMQGFLAIPEIVMVLLLLWLALRWKLPLPGAAPQGDDSMIAAMFVHGASMLAPCLALALGLAPVLYRHIRSAWRLALDAPFVQAARMAGVPPRRLRWGYVLPAAANPLISLSGLLFGGLFSASLVVEAATGWPGLGPLLVEAVFARDTHVVVGAVLLAGLAMFAGNAMADLLLLRLDPRIQRP